MAFVMLYRLFFFLLLLKLVAGQDKESIILGSHLLASDEPSSWKSSFGDFAFGFRYLEDQELFLLAIWFNKIPDRTIVWYANGDNPVPKGSKVELTADGQLSLTDPRQQVIWETRPGSTGVAYAAMLDTGNFVLAFNESDYAWESFKNPTDTMLPTQALDIGEKLSSGQMAGNFLKGRFQLRMLPEGNLVLNTMSVPSEYAYEPYYVSNTEDSGNSFNSGFRLVFNESGYLYIALKNGEISNLTSGKIVPTSDFYHRATLNFDGIFTQYAHPKPSRNTSLDQSWFPVWSIPDNICLATLGTLGSGVCGFNSYCILDSNSRPKCACPPGYSYIDPNNTFNGCKLDRVPSTCHGEDQENHEPEELYDMHVMSSTFWPTSNYEVQQKFNETECRQSCLYDCHCMVAVSRAGFCFKKKLPLSNGKVDPAFPATCFIKVLKSRVNSTDEMSTEKKYETRTLVLIGSILLGGSVFLNIVAAICSLVNYFYKKQQKLPKIASSSGNTAIRTFTYENLREATDGFKEELGKGSFGTVYKGFLTSSTSSELAAVKKLDRVIEEGEHEFKTEVSVIAQTHHRNLVRLLGFCDEGPHKLLVYEFMSNGSLASYLFGVSRPSWSKRIQIISGIARGLLYLHEDCAMQIIHCDIKPQNILLDDSLTAKISDFGLAKLLLSDQTRTNTAIRGTRGYIAPEWFKNIPITAKADVYSYGVILLEIICCRKNVEQGMEDEDEFVLTDWAYDCYRHRELHKLLKSDKEARNDRKRVEKLVMVAIWCIQEDPCLRPTMKKVIQMLEGVIDVSVPPCPFPLSSVC